MTQTPGNKAEESVADKLMANTPAIREQVPEVSEVDLKELAGKPTHANADSKPLEDGTLISFDMLVMNFLQQHHNTMEEYNNKLHEEQLEDERSTDVE